MYGSDIETEAANFEMAELEAIGNQEAALKKQGLCAHSWRQGHFDGTATCLNCGKTAPESELDEERRELLI